MKLRELIDQNSGLVTAIAVTVLIAALAYIVLSSGRGVREQRPVDVYFYDVSAKQLFAKLNTEVPPTEVPGSGTETLPTGVRAHVFTCGECSEDEIFVGWLETFTPDAKRNILEMRERSRVDGVPIMPDLLSNEGHLISDSEGAAWYPAGSDQARDVLQRVRHLCEGNHPKPCRPRN